MSDSSSDCFSLCSSAHLIDCQVDASVRDDAQHVGDVAFVEGKHSLALQDLFGAVWDALVLASLSQRQTGFENLNRGALWSLISNIMPAELSEIQMKIATKNL